MNEVVIGLGSNIEPDVNIPLAREALTRLVVFVGQAPVLQTPPLGMSDCDFFRNTAFLVRTSLSVEELNASLKRIERSLGRPQKHGKYDPRTIDLDVLVFNNKIVDKDVFGKDYLRTLVHHLLPEVI